MVHINFDSNVITIHFDLNLIYFAYKYSCFGFISNQRPNLMILEPKIGANPISDIIYHYYSDINLLLKYFILTQFNGYPFNDNNC